MIKYYLWQQESNILLVHMHLKYLISLVGQKCSCCLFRVAILNIAVVIRHS